MILRDHGLAVEVPRGWDARIFRRPESAIAVPSAPEAPDAPAPQSGWTDPILHLANFALPEQRGDYGSGAVNLMGASHVFIALVEFGPASAGTAMFSASGMPRLRAASLATQTMQRPIPGMAGVQRFFHVGAPPEARAFCCYAVIGSFARRSVLAPVLNAALAGIDIGARSG